VESRRVELVELVLQLDAAFGDDQPAPVDTEYPMSAHRIRNGSSATPPAPASPDLRNPSPPAAARPRQPACEQLVKDPTYPGTVRLAASPFRHGLLASTVSNTPDAQNFAAMVERAGGWLIVMAADAAQQQGKDWRPAAAAARQRARLAPLPAAYMPCPPGDP